MIKERLLERGAFFVGIVAGKTAKVIHPNQVKSLSRVKVSEA
jgi:hypothetical protein